MGIDNAPLDVEESTEPPICAYTQEHNSQHHSHPRDVKDTPDLEKAASHRPGKSLDEHHPATPTRHFEEHLSTPTEHAHTVDPSSLSAFLGVDLQHGLSDAEASSRLERDGPNSVGSMEGLSVWKILLRQVSNSLTLILVIVMGVSFGINDYIEGGVITAVILLNIVVGFVQDYRAEKDILSLQRLSAPICKALRNGHVTSVKAESLVVGDIVQLAVGDIVPADMRLFEGMNVSMDEALLTGESLPVAKTPHVTLTSPDMPIGDRTNMAYSGCSTTQGRATGVITATGMNTEVGKIAQLLQDKVEHDGANIIVRLYRRVMATVKNILGLVGTPLQVKLSKFALLLFALAVLLAIIVFSVNVWDIQGEVLIYGICVAVAVVPESLIAVLTITMAVGTKAMARGNVIVRKLQCLEAVGGVTNICSDKTGTLTQGKMVARTAWIPDTGILTVHQTTNPFDPSSGVVRFDGKDIGPKDIQDEASNTFITALSLCNLSIVHNITQSAPEDGVPTQVAEGDWTAVGEPTEIALRVFSMRFGYDKANIVRDRDLTLHTEYPFDSSVKKMTVVYTNRHAQFNEVYSKGAPEALISSLDISDAEKEVIQETAERMAGEGLRVLCIAFKKCPLGDEPQIVPRNNAESHLKFGGLIGLYDPPRLETAAAVRKCQMAGITVHMLTGDHIRTATAIASEVGILDPVVNAASSRLVMAAKEFDRLSDADVDAIEQLPLVIARCSPTTKVRMVEAMHRRSAFCVMTGDGVNDSPALKRADVGIAMGKNGSDVAKEAADMVLTDDNFASIVKAVEEGRRLFDNIQKFLMHLLISNIAQVILLLIALAFKDEEGNSIFPLSPLEILWANLVTSSFLALGLGLEEAQPDIMYRPPHDLKIGVFTRELITDKMVYGTFMGSLCLVAFVIVIYGAGEGTASMGHGCNEGWNSSCGNVFEARATTYAVLTFLLLVTAWEVKHFSRSLFNLDPDRNPGKLSVFNSVWRNQFLFWAVIAGFVIAFPVIYLPEVNRVVFKHQGITWHWGVVFGCVVVYLVLVESWKAAKRRFGIGTGKNATLTMEDAEMRAGLRSLTPISMSANASVEESMNASVVTEKK
ncbi:putative potassium/sodium P-type ATPase [Aspergillus undulatus]|uniref:putative potassium/sodium P-type ATPase n=1 Tax=Aspergillus undulatus TaxID=1810928 RepID=UPI003CCD5741